VPPARTSSLNEYWPATAKSLVSQQPRCELRDRMGRRHVDEVIAEVVVRSVFKKNIIPAETVASETAQA